MKKDLKRQNFNVTPEQEAQLDVLKENLDAPSVKDAILRSAQITNLLVREARAGYQLYVRSKDGEMKQVLIPEFEDKTEWVYLAPRPGSVYKQYFIKGRRIRAAVIYGATLSNEMTPQEVADDYDLPLGVVEECIRYSKANLDLIGEEAERGLRYAEEDRQRLIAAGHKFGN